MEVILDYGTTVRTSFAEGVCIPDVAIEFSFAM